MDLDDIKNIPIGYLVESLGGRYAYSRAKCQWWYSCLRPGEKSPSLKVNTEANVFKDFGDHRKGGSIIDLYLDYHNMDRRDKAGIKQAMEDISKLSPADLIPYKRKQVTVQYSDRYKMTTPSDLYSDSLKNTLAYRGLHWRMVKDYLRQTNITDTETQKKYVGFAFLNDKDGHDISIPNIRTRENFKLCIGPKSITTLHGEKDKKGNAYVFEGWADFCTWLHVEPNTEPECQVILNSTSLVDSAADYLIAHKKDLEMVYLFMDNDPAGERAAGQLGVRLEEAGIKFGTMNHRYEGFKDLNAWWMDRIGNIGAGTRTYGPALKIQPK